jgi:glycerol-3-phosphate dehydrogenase (NAD(P)+)
MRRAVGVLGGGPWGVALACAARRAGHDVLLCTRKSDSALAALELPTTGDVRALAKAATLIFVAVPSEVVREVARGLGDAIDGSHYVVHGIRGLSVEGLTPISDVIRDETPCRRVGAIGGPGVARDLTEGNLGVLAAASRFPEVTAAVREALESPALRVSCTHDLTGLEWASALNGCLLVAVGYGRAIGASPAVLAGLLTRGIHEASRVGVAAGAEASTFFSIAGIGDVLAAMGGDERPEVRLGVALGEGATPEQARSRAGQRVEAPAVALQVLAFAKERRLEVPVFRTIAAAMAGTITREEVLKGLMARDKH